MACVPRDEKRVRPTTTALYLVVGVVYGAFLVSTLPGVRQQPGYNLLLDGVLNNIAYELSALVCFVRARHAVMFVRSYFFLGVGLALYGLGNIFWTVFVRTQEPEPFPSAADALWLSFYVCAFVALWLIVREIAEGVPVSLWLDGVVGGLAVAGVAAAFIGPVLAITGGSVAEVVTTLAYPLLDVLLLLVVTAMVALFQWRPPLESLVPGWRPCHLLLRRCRLSVLRQQRDLRAGRPQRRSLGCRHPSNRLRARVGRAGIGRSDAGVAATRSSGRGDPRRTCRPRLWKPARPQRGGRRVVRRHHCLSPSPAHRHLSRSNFSGPQPRTGSYRRAHGTWQQALLL